MINKIRGGSMFARTGHRGSYTNTKQYGWLDWMRFKKVVVACFEGETTI